MVFRHRVAFTDTCDRCGKHYEPWLLTLTVWGEYICQGCLDESDEDLPEVEQYDE